MPSKEIYLSVRDNNVYAMEWAYYNDTMKRLGAVWDFGRWPDVEKQMILALETRQRQGLIVTFLGCIAEEFAGVTIAAQPVIIAGEAVAHRYEVTISIDGLMTVSHASDLLSTSLAITVLLALEDKAGVQKWGKANV